MCTDAKILDLCIFYCRYQIFDENLGPKITDKNVVSSQREPISTDKKSVVSLAASKPKNWQSRVEGKNQLQECARKCSEWGDWEWIREIVRKSGTKPLKPGLSRANCEFWKKGWRSLNGFERFWTFSASKWTTILLTFGSNELCFAHGQRVTGFKPARWCFKYPPRVQVGAKLKSTQKRKGKKGGLNLVPAVGATQKSRKERVHFDLQGNSTGKGKAKTKKSCGAKTISKQKHLGNWAWWGSREKENGSGEILRRKNREITREKMENKKIVFANFSNGNSFAEVEAKKMKKVKRATKNNYARRVKQNTFIWRQMKKKNPQMKNWKIKK